MNTYNLRKSLITAIAIIMPIIATAQSSAVKKAAESVFTLTTFKADGSILATSHGAFVEKSGIAISDLTPFIGAKSAVVIDAKGNKKNVTRICGINDIYNVAKFKVEGTTKFLKPAQQSTPTGGQLWLIPYSNKQPKPESAMVKSVEKFMDKYSYYITSNYATGNTEACPFVNSNGEAAGLMQTSATSTEMHATDANFILSLTTNALSINDATFRKIGIPAMLPDEKNQAILTLMMAKQDGDSVKYAAAADDFLKQFPNLIDGYVAKAEMELNAGRIDEARKIMETALANVDNKDDAHYNYAKVIYTKETYINTPYEAWTLDKALDETEKAYAINKLPLYKELSAQILFAKKDYEKAYNTFMDLTKSNIKSGDLFYNAALCKEQLNADNSEILALLDSAVNNVDTLNIREAAKSFLMRGDVYNRMGNYRQAVFDYTRYEVVAGERPTAAFYYVREQAEVKAKLFKQALADIDNAIFVDPNEPSFRAEKASLQLRLNLNNEAMATAEECVKLYPDNSDAYLILGLAQVKTGKKTDGMANLRKAKELGNEQAQPLIDKYNK